MDALSPIVPVPTQYPMHPENGARVAILWAEVATDMFDRCTVVDVDDDTMTVRVGWVGSRPLLMRFPREVRELVVLDDRDAYPLVREAGGVPLNFPA